jgi:hypothetical protein
LPNHLYNRIWAVLLDYGHRPKEIFTDGKFIKLERVKGIEPSSQPWEGHILPLNHTRLHTELCFYQTRHRLATGLIDRQEVVTKRLIAECSFSVMSFCLSGEVIFPPSSSRT